MLRILDQFGFGIDAESRWQGYPASNPRILVAAVEHRLAVRDDDLLDVELQQRLSARRNSRWPVPAGSHDRAESHATTVSSENDVAGHERALLGQPVDDLRAATRRERLDPGR